MIGLVSGFGKVLGERIVIIARETEEFGSQLREGRKIREHKLFEEHFQFVEFGERDSARSLQMHDAIAARDHLAPVVEEQFIRLGKRGDVMLLAVSTDA